MRCTACGAYEDQPHDADCIYQEHHELELRCEELERRLTWLIGELRGECLRKDDLLHRDAYKSGISSGLAGYAWADFIRAAIARAEGE